MAQNKVQYQRGLSMPEFFDRFGSPEQCEALVLHLVLRHGQPPVQVATSSQAGGSPHAPLPGRAELPC